MDKLTLRHWPYPSLLTPTKVVTKVDSQLLEWATQMKDIVRAHEAAGLAANQAGLPYRMFVTDSEVFINPVIKRSFGGIEVKQEGCLSLPGYWLPIPRHRKAVLHAYNEKGEEILRTLSGHAARVALHECQHLEGQLFFNSLSPGAFIAAGMVETLDEVFAQFAAEPFDQEGYENERQQLIAERTA